MLRAPLFLLLALTTLTFGQDTTHTSATAVSPRIVARVALTAQTAGIPTTPLYTPAADGLFRISVYATMSTAGSTGKWWVNTFWTDDGGAEENTAYQLPANGKAPTASCNSVGSACGPSVWVVSDKAGVPLSYDVEAHAGAAGTYDVYIVVEQLM